MGVRWLCGFIYDISAGKSYLSCDLGRPGGGKARESAEEKGAMNVDWVDETQLQALVSVLRAIIVSFISIT